MLKRNKFLLITTLTLCIVPSKAASGTQSNTQYTTWYLNKKMEGCAYKYIRHSNISGMDLERYFQKPTFVIPSEEISFLEKSPYPHKIPVIQIPQSIWWEHIYKSQNPPPSEADGFEIMANILNVFKFGGFFSGITFACTYLSTKNATLACWGAGAIFILSYLSITKRKRTSEKPATEFVPYETTDNNQPIIRNKFIYVKCTGLARLLAEKAQGINEPAFLQENDHQAKSEVFSFIHLS